MFIKLNELNMGGGHKAYKGYRNSSDQLKYLNMVLDGHLRVCRRDQNEFSVQGLHGYKERSRVLVPNMI